MQSVPITFVERERGESKMSGAIVAESLLRVTLWGATRRFAGLRELMRHGRRLSSVRHLSHRAFRHS
jgi:dolichol-phosphate mannosyltransferase